MRIIDTKTNQTADPYVAAKEEWASSLMTNDIEGFAITQDGAIVLMDECGNMAYAPAGRYRYVDTPLPIPSKKSRAAASSKPMTMDELFSAIDKGAAEGADVWVWLDIYDPEKAGIRYTSFPTEHGYVRACRQWKDSNDGAAFWSGDRCVLLMVEDGAGEGWNVYANRPQPHAEEALSKEYLISLMGKVKAHLDKEWVWIEPIGEGKSIHAWHAEPIEAGYYRAQNVYTDGEGFCCGWPGVGYCFEFDEMGVTWNAYHTKPE